MFRDWNSCINQTYEFSIFDHWLSKSNQTSQSLQNLVKNTTWYLYENQYLCINHTNKDTLNLTCTCRPIRIAPENFTCQSDHSLNQTLMPVRKPLEIIQYNTSIGNLSYIQYHPCHIWQLAILEEPENYWNLFFWEKFCCCGKGTGNGSGSGGNIGNNDGAAGSNSGSGGENESIESIKKPSRAHCSRMKAFCSENKNVEIFQISKNFTVFIFSIQGPSKMAI